MKLPKKKIHNGTHAGQNQGFPTNHLLKWLSHCCKFFQTGGISSSQMLPDIFDGVEDFSSKLWKFLLKLQLGTVSLTNCQ